MIQVVVLAGGQGTRLKTVTGASPKALACANGRPLLDLQLSHFAACGVREVLILTGYGADEIVTYCADGGAWGLSIQYAREPEALGTAGALFHARSLLHPEFLVTYGDTVFDFDLARIVAAHRSGAQVATLLLHPNDHPHDSDLVEVDGADRIVAFHPYPHTESGFLPNLVNAGIYVLNQRILDSFDGLPEKPDFGRHLFPRLLQNRQLLFGYRSPEYVKDAGTPARLAQVSRDLASGRVAGLSLRVPAPAVFLDRDGTINLEKNRIADPDALELYPGAAAALARLNRSTYRTVIVTNQPVVARGDTDEAGLLQIHSRLERLLGAEGSFVDRIYHCPHIPDRGFPGERVELKIICDCRKPEIGMVTLAARDLNIDLSRSWLVGDSTTDIETARRAGLTSILVATGHGGRDGKWPCQPDIECADLPDAVTLILDRWPNMLETVRPLASQISPGDIVLIGGHARSGKSQYASALRRCLEAADRPATVICLDSWLRAEDDRTGTSVLDRYDLATAAAFICRAATSSGRYFLPRYDRVRRTRVGDGVELEIARHAVIIVEGVPALASTALIEISQHHIAVRRREADRRAAMRRDYTSRGWPLAHIDQLIVARLKEEFPTIDASLTNASIVVENGQQQ